MDVIYIIVVQNNYVYNVLVIERNQVVKCSGMLQRNNAHGDDRQMPSRSKMKMFSDGILAHYFLKELEIGRNYRINFIDTFYANKERRINTIKLHLVPPDKEMIDYSWNDRMTYLLRERCELEHTLSWLSTLGGAFSALGDYFINFAEVAGKISLNQLCLAFRLRDPIVISKCRLFVSLSLIQRHHFKLAKEIIRAEYIKAENDVVIDLRLINMCKGIWCKLKYEYEIYKTRKYLK